ncbi:MAG: hypothetical protein M1828_004617 [Chrysothrix sp. TS-e1954]|nr:MAG: hypothetical protein M1828_004617 [Chrysothrix sp. TS-e1954]
MNPQEHADKFNSEMIAMLALNNLQAVDSTVYGENTQFVKTALGKDIESTSGRDVSKLCPKYKFEELSMTAEDAAKRRNHVRQQLPEAYRGVPDTLKTPDGVAQVVQRFAQAIGVTTGARDAEHIDYDKDGKELRRFVASKEWNAMNRQKHSPEDIEEVAWQIAETLIDLHENGLRIKTVSLPILTHGTDMYDPDAKIPIWQRIDKVEVLLQDWKLCWGDIKRGGHSAVWHLVRCPDGTARRKRQNQFNNRQKKKLIQDSPAHMRRRQNQIKLRKDKGLPPLPAHRVRAKRIGRRRVATEVAAGVVRPEDPSVEDSEEEEDDDDEEEEEESEEEQFPGYVWDSDPPGGVPVDEEDESDGSDDNDEDDEE